eukprot:1914482-Pyramimonas_sp.AAC.1
MEGEGTEKNPELGFKWYLAAGEDVFMAYEFDITVNVVGCSQKGHGCGRHVLHSLLLRKSHRDRAGLA